MTNPSPLAPMLLVCALGVFSMSAAPVIHVSASGDDAANGGPQNPVRTLARARELTRSAPERATGDITIVVHGLIRLSDPLQLTSEDSGKGGHNIIYTGADGSRAIITGARQVTGWKLVDAAKNLWAAPAPPGVANSRQLFVNGARARRAADRPPLRLERTASGYTTESPLLTHWRNPADIEFVYTGGNNLWSEKSAGLGAWTEPRCPVAAISATEITMAQPCWDNSTRRVMLPADSGFHRTANLVGPASIGKTPTAVENAFELLTAPGQGDFDRAAAAIYYIPRPGEDLAGADVELPVLEKLIDGRGSPDHPIHNIIFRHLEFTGATWLYPSSNEGFSEIQANYMVTGSNGYAVQGLCQLAPGGTCPYGAWTKTPGNVSFAYDQQLQFDDCAFIHLGGAGLELGDGSQSNVVEGCVFTDISANGLELGGVDLPEGSGASITSDNRIVNNHIFNVAAEYPGGIGLCVGYAQRTVIEHNQLEHLPYTGISIGWGGWPDKIKKAGQANFSRDNRIAHNLIFDHMLLLADGSAIYTQGLTGPSLDDGELIEGNVIHDQFGTGHGIYTDNGCKNVTARGNVIFHTNHDNWGGRHHDYYDGQTGANYDNFVFEDNYWQQGDRDSSRQNVILRHNHLISSLDDVPRNLLDSAGLEPRHRGLLDERFAPPSRPDAPAEVAVTAANGAAWIAWCPPVDEGGAPVSSYVVRSSGGPSTTISAAEFHQKGYAVISGLASTEPCQFTVAASNSFGVGPFSLPSASVAARPTDIQPPAAPQNVSADFADNKVSVHFQAPKENGSGPILSYVCTIEPGGRRVVFSGRPILTLEGTHKTFAVVDNVPHGPAYRIELAAVNPAGEGQRAEAKLSGEH